MITFSVFFITLFLGLPILLTLMLGTLVFLHQSDLLLLSSSLPLQFYGALEKNGLLAIPLFMLVGELMNRGGLTDRLVELANLLLGRMRGGLAYVNLLTNAVAASILGSAIAQIAVMSKVMIPAMEKQGYKRDFAAAVTVSGGLLGPIIPPSMIMIIYGVIALQPISALFLAGLLPGLLIFLGFVVVVMMLGFIHDFPKLERTARRKVSLIGLLKQLSPLMIPVFIIFGISAGVMTPTEAGAVGALLALIIGKWIYRSILWSDLPEIFKQVALNTALITGLIAAATMFGWALSFVGVPDRIVAMINAWTQSPWVFLLLINLLVVVLGMFLESMSILIVLVPIVLPTVLALGIDPIHFGVVISLATLIGLVTPPVGPGLFVVTSTTQVSMFGLFRAMIPFLIAMFVCMAIINLVPALSLWLPQQLGLS